jgi:hypothetical protein
MLIHPGELATKVTPFKAIADRGHSASRIMTRPLTV